MVSPEVQAKIFTGVQANPCNTTLDLNALAEESGDPITKKLAEACTQVNSAETVVTDLNYVWGIRRRKRHHQCAYGIRSRGNRHRRPV